MKTDVLLHGVVEDLNKKVVKKALAKKAKADAVKDVATNLDVSNQALQNAKPNYVKIGIIVGGVALAAYAGYKYFKAN